MKIKRFSLFGVVSIAISGLIILLILSGPNETEIFPLNHQNQTTAPEFIAAASISKGTILVLLVVGLIGFLGVSRKKKEGGRPAHNNDTPQTTGHDSFNEGR